jgi:hypothetical protein
MGAILQIYTLTEAGEGGLGRAKPVVWVGASEACHTRSRVVENSQLSVDEASQHANPRALNIGDRTHHSKLLLRNEAEDEAVGGGERSLSGRASSTNLLGILILCAVFALVPCTSDSVLVLATETDGVEVLRRSRLIHLLHKSQLFSSGCFLLLRDTSCSRYHMCREADLFKMCATLVPKIKIKK